MSARFPTESSPTTEPTTDHQSDAAVAATRARVAAAALSSSPGGRVGLELELHPYDLRTPARRLDWGELTGLVGRLPVMPAGSRISIEPGGQLELSTPPMDGPGEAVRALRTDRAVLGAAVARSGLALVAFGADPVRIPERVSPQPRYVAMERHFRARGCGEAGLAMMSATAALQINLDAGPPLGWTDRVQLVQALGPLLVAVSAASPVLGGRRSGWASMRQEAWYGIDRHRAGPVAFGDQPAASWARHVLAAPVMQVRDAERTVAVAGSISFESWLRGDGPVERPPTRHDLDDHLTTLFPPVRPRGYLELRCLDAVPDRWWPGLVAFVVALVDTPAVTDTVREIVQPVGDLWTSAARHGLADLRLARAAQACAAVALSNAPIGLASELEAFCRLIDAGQSPADQLQARIERVGLSRFLEEEADA